MKRAMRDQMREMRRDPPPGTARFALHHPKGECDITEITGNAAREGQHIGGLCLGAMRPIQSLHGGIISKQHSDRACGPRFAQGNARRAARQRLRLFDGSAPA
jgi:hypothetical protein